MNRFTAFLIPDLICNSIYEIPKKYLNRKKIRAIIFDIDNTLVPYDVEVPDEKLIAYLRSFEEKGIRVALVSNNSRERVEKFNENLGFFTVPDAHKPKKSALLPAIEEFSPIKRKNILFVGDQLLTDVLVARRNHLRVIAVHPIKRKENLFFRFKRTLEKPFIREYYQLKKAGRKRVGEP